MGRTDTTQSRILPVPVRRDLPGGAVESFQQRGPLFVLHNSHEMILTRTYYLQRYSRAF
jgi:hypothetical protein